MPRCMLVGVLCWVISSMCLADELTDAALAEDAGEIEVEGGGQGLVIELDESAPAESAPEGDGSAGGFRQRELADSDVELIVGGQGQDGIAKRSRLKKED